MNLPGFQGEEACEKYDVLVLHSDTGNLAEVGKPLVHFTLFCWVNSPFFL